MSIGIELFNVRDFGAVGDGDINDKNDDTKAFEACHDAAKNFGHKQIYVPSGTYILEGLVLDNIGIKGEIGTTLKLKKDAKNRMIIVSGKDVYFEHLNFDGNEVNNRNTMIGDTRREHGKISLISNVISFKSILPDKVYKIHGLFIQDCTFENSRHFPIFLYSLKRGSPDSTDSKTPPDYENEQGDVHRLNVTRCRFKNCPGGWIGCTGPDWDYPFEPLAVQIHDNYFDGAVLVDRKDPYYKYPNSRYTSNGFLFDRGSDWKITNNFFNNTGRGITKSGDVSDFLFSGNTCRNLRGGFQFASARYVDKKTLKPSDKLANDENNKDIHDLNIQIINNDVECTLDDLNDEEFIAFFSQDPRTLFRVRGITIANNIIKAKNFNRNGSDAIQLFALGIDGVRIYSNRIIGWDHSITFYSRGEQGYGEVNQVVIYDNEFVNPRRQHINFVGCDYEFFKCDPNLVCKPEIKKCNMPPHENRWKIDIYRNKFKNGGSEGGSYPVEIASNDKIVNDLSFTYNRFEGNSKIGGDIHVGLREIDTPLLIPNDYEKGISMAASSIKDIKEIRKGVMACFGNDQFRTQLTQIKTINHIASCDGQEVTIHFINVGKNNSPNVILKHNPSSIVLKDGNDFSPSDGTIMQFIRRNGITYEINRVVP